MEPILGHSFDVFYDLIGRGWRIGCTCGFTTELCQDLQSAGAQVDDHMQEATPR